MEKGKEHRRSDALFRRNAVHSDVAQKEGFELRQASSCSSLVVRSLLKQYDFRWFIIPLCVSKYQAVIFP